MKLFILIGYRSSWLALSLTYYSNYRTDPARLEVPREVLVEFVR